MGLDTTHDCWHGAYSGFHRWRKAVAKAAGLPPLGFMQGFWNNPNSTGEHMGDDLIVTVIAGTLKRLMPPRPGDEYTSDHATLLRLFDFDAIRWDSLKPDPLHALLYHSDCDGEIPATECGPIADRLTELLPLMPKGEGGGHIGDWTAKTQQFIDGLRRAASAGESVRFQ